VRERILARAYESAGAAGEAEVEQVRLTPASTMMFRRLQIAVNDADAVGRSTASQT